MAEIIIGIIEALSNMICALEPDAADDFAEIIAVAKVILNVEG